MLDEINLHRVVSAGQVTVQTLVAKAPCFPPLPFPTVLVVTLRHIVMHAHPSTIAAKHS